MNVAGALAWGSAVLERGGKTGHGRDCELLLAHAAGRDRHWTLLNRELPLPELAWARFRSLVLGRVAGTPVRYLTGSVEFFGLELSIGRGRLHPQVGDRGPGRSGAGASGRAAAT